MRQDTMTLTIDEQAHLAYCAARDARSITSTGFGSVMPLALAAIAFDVRAGAPTADEIDAAVDSLGSL